MLSLAAMGRGTGSVRFTPVPPRLERNRATYAYPGVSEWYVNGPVGLEQGFQVVRRPGGRGLLTLDLSLKGNLRPHLRDGEILLSGPRTSLQYTGLSATDDRGRRLPAWVSVAGAGLQLHVEDRGAVYPLRVDPFIEQQQLAASGAGQTGFTQIESGDLGTNLALSADGNTAVVGAPYDNSRAGAAWVFTRSAGIWSLQQKLTADGDGHVGSGEVGAGSFGSSVAMSADGDTVLIAGYNDNPHNDAASESGEGAAWIFTRSGATWTQQQELTGDGDGHVGSGEQDDWSSSPNQPGRLYGEFGSSVALSASGDTALIGAQSDHSYEGAAWVFTRAAGTWTQQQELTGDGDGHVGSGEIGTGWLGISVALSADGDTALIGAAGDGDGSSPGFNGYGFEGAAWVFTSSGGTWSQQQKLTADGDGHVGSGEIPRGYFGTTVAMSQDGTTALVGAPNDHSYDAGAAIAYGAAWVFTHSSGGWSQQQELTADGDGHVGSGELGYGLFGGAVALSGDGSTALIGAHEDNGNAGSAWTFSRSAGNWSQTQELTAQALGATGSNTSVGGTTALSSDDTTGLIGPEQGNQVWAIAQAPPAAAPNPSPAPLIPGPPLALPVNLIDLTPSAPLATISLVTSRLVVARGMLPVRLDCRSAACAGTARLIRTVRVKLHSKSSAKGRRRRPSRWKTQTQVLAAAAYGVAAGKTATVYLRLTAVGRRLLRGVAAHPLNAVLDLTASGGRQTAAPVRVT